MYIPSVLSVEYGTDRISKHELQREEWIELFRDEEIQEKALTCFVKRAFLKSGLKQFLSDESNGQKLPAKYILFDGISSKMHLS